MTHDGLFLVQKLQAAEIPVLLRILATYHAYMKGHVGSFLPWIVGVYTVASGTFAICADTFRTSLSVGLSAVLFRPFFPYVSQCRP